MTTTSIDSGRERLPIRLAALDLAGTLVSDDGTVRHAFEDALAELGIRPTVDHRRVVDETMGQSKVEVFRRLLGSDNLASQAAAAFEVAYERRIPGTAPLPGAEETLTWLAAARIKVCLTTGFSERTRSTLLGHLGWSRYPALSPGPHVRGRPAPDLVLTALMSAGLDDVREVAAVGDTVNDLLAGWRAGAGMVVGVLTGAHNRATLAGAPHTHLLASVADLPDAIAMHAG